MNNNSLLGQIFRASRPWDAVLVILFYLLGAGIAPYQGHDLNWFRFGLGLLAALFLLFSAHFLKEFFEQVEVPVLQRRDLLPRQVFLVAALACLMGVTVITLLLVVQGGVSLIAFVVIGLAVLVAALYAVPPFRLVHTAYGELARALLMVNLIPALAATLQTGEIYRILPAVTFPLTALFMSMALAHSFPSYAADIASGRNRNLLQRIGWENAASLHNILLLVAYLMMAGVSLLGLPWGVFGPAFLTLPVALFQIWQMLRLAAGSAVNWRVLVVTSAGTLAVTCYLLALGLWTG